MAASLETRGPYLDHRIVEFAWRLPRRMKIRSRESKWLLRQLLWRFVPRELIERPKQGFGIPVDEWLRGPLRDWAFEMLSPVQLRAQGLFNSEFLNQILDDHLSERRNNGRHMWNICILQNWLRENNVTV